MVSQRLLPILLCATAVAAAAGIGACGDDSGAPPTGPDDEIGCRSTDEDFVENAIFAVLGRRPWGVAEVTVYTQLLGQLRERDGEDEARRQLALALTHDPAYTARWGNVVMDSLQVSRTLFRRDRQYGLLQATSCYGAPASLPTLGPELATYVRDNSPSSTAPPMSKFTLGMLLNSSIVLDDLSPVYRAHLFHLVSFPLAGANVDPDELERSRRNAFGIQFEETYLNRNPTCLPCHNSEFSVTPDRTFPLPGRVEAALYGSSTAGPDPLVYRSVFRTEDVIGGSRAPWGWNEDQCGAFDAPTSADPLGYETSFGSIGGERREAERASVWQLELALARGFASLRDGFEVDAQGNVASPDEALAHLVSTSAVEVVWDEIMGSRLTIAHHFPRNESQREILERLVGNFAQSGYSLRNLVADVVSDPLFSLPPADAACWGEAYALPPVLEPFATNEADESRRGNAPGDAVVTASTRTLLSSLYAAMEWPSPPELPRNPDDETWHSSVGLFLNVDQKGFRGLDLQGRLSWEERYGTCDAGVEGDFIDGVLALAEADPSATIGDVVVAIRDRVWTDAAPPTAEERPLIEAMVGASLDSREFAEREAGLRLYCGALVASPQFMLVGVGDGLEPAEPPRLVQPGRDVAGLCEELRTRIEEWAPAACGSEGIELL